MSNLEDERYSIGAVVSQLQESCPGISHSSLRFLEREGLVTPARTLGGHRLYTQDDIALILQIKKWQGQNLSLEMIRHRLREMHSLDSPALLSREFMERGVAGRFMGAGSLLLAADDSGKPLVWTFGEVLEPALVEVGERWQDGTLLVAQEKQFSETARDVISQLSQRHARIDPDKLTLLAACVEGDRHELGLRMIVGMLRSEGYPVHFLGADVHPSFLLEAVRLHRPRVVLLSIDLPEHVPALEATLDALREASPGVGEITVMVGGKMALAQPDVLDAYGEIVIHGDGIREVLDEIRQVLLSTTTHAGV